MGGTTLSNTEKAGVLGMTAVVILSLGLVISAGGGEDESPLNPDGRNDKVRSALEEQDTSWPVENATQPALSVKSNKEKNKEKADELFGDLKNSREKQSSGKKSVNPSPRKKDAGKKSKSGYRKYTIRDGDVLTVLSQKYLGTMRRWKEIKKLNPKINEDYLIPGTEILLPPRNPGSGRKK